MNFNKKVSFLIQANKWAMLKDTKQFRLLANDEKIRFKIASQHRGKL